MKITRKCLIGKLLICIVIIMVGCGESSGELNVVLDNQSLIQNSDDGLSQIATDIEENTEKNVSISNDKADSINSGNKHTTPSTKKGSLKEEYLIKINSTKKETDKLEVTDFSTYAMKKVENDRWEMWDQLLNEIYDVLKGQLSPEEMEQLREKQRNWLKYRDNHALEASLKYKGGTQEQLEYVAVLANLTEQRCYELVENYMK